MDTATQPQIDSVRLKLVQLLDSISTLQDVLFAHSSSTQEPSTLNPAIPSWPDLLSRYNLLLSHVVGLGALMSSVGDGQAMGQGQAQGADVKRRRWEASAVVPAVEVDESSDWIVGMLLRTQQSPEVKENLTNLIRALPSEFTNSATYAAAITARQSLTAFASSKVSQLRETAPDGDEWDWKGRVEVGSEGEDEDEMDEINKLAEEDEKMEGVEAEAKSAWTVKQLATYARTGRLPQ